MPGVCESCLQNLHTLFLPFLPEVDLPCSLWDSETSAEFFLSVERLPMGKARQLCRLSRRLRAEPWAQSSQGALHCPGGHDTSP